MNPQVKEKWLSALRSGEYEQTRQYLHNEDGFCCLGVLCDLYGKENNVEWKLVNNGNNYRFQDRESNLPDSVMEWAGTETNNPVTYYNSIPVSLANLNDSGNTFIEIADLIQEHL